MALSGCAVSGGDVRCPDGAGGSFWTARLGVALEVAVPVCQPGTATATSDPTQGVTIATQALGLAAGLTKLVAPE